MVLQTDVVHAACTLPGAGFPVGPGHLAPTPRAGAAGAARKPASGEEDAVVKTVPMQNSLCAVASAACV